MDRLIVKRVQDINAGNQKLLKMTTTMFGANEIQAQDPDVIRASMDRIFDAPMSVDLIERVVPNQKLLAMKLQTKLHEAAAILMSGNRTPETMKAIMRIMEKADKAEGLVSKLDAYAQMLPKYDAASALTALHNLYRDIYLFNQGAAEVADYVAPMIGDSYDKELTLLQREVETGLTLAFFKASNVKSSLHTPEQAYKRVHLLMAELRHLLYSSSFTEFFANATMMRSKMTEADLAQNPRPAFVPLYENLGHSAKWLEQQADSSFTDVTGPQLRMIGGSAGSKPMNVSIFGEASGNMFKAGMRMIARGALLSHYVSELNKDIKSFGKVTYNSKGWRIGSDGMPVYVNEVGTLSGTAPLLDPFSGTFGLATGVENMVNIANQVGPRAPELTALRVVQDQFGNFRGNEQAFDEKVMPIVKLVSENSFTASQGSYHADGHPITFMAGLSRDGRSVTIQDVAKAMGAVVHVEDTIGYTSEVMNALYKASERGIPGMIKAEELASVLKNAGVADTELHSARVFDIQEKFRGAELSVDELVDIVAVLHEVPMLSTYQAGTTMKSLMIDAIKSAGPAESFKKLYDYALKSGDDDSAHAEAMRAFINNRFQNDERGGVPLSSILKRKGDVGGSVTGSRFFLMDVITTAISFDWNAEKGIARMIGKEASKEVIKRIQERLVKKYPNENTLPPEWDAEKLGNMLVSRTTNMSMGPEATYDQKDKQTLAAYMKFATRLENLLVKLTPMAKRLGENLVKTLKNEDPLVKNSDKRSAAMKAMLVEFYSSAIEEGMKDSFSISAIDEMGGSSPWNTVSEFSARSEGGQSHRSNVQTPSLGLLTKMYGYGGDAAVTGTMVMHGLMGGAQQAFAGHAYLRSIQSGMAGAALYPTNVHSAENHAIEGFPGSPIAGQHRSLTFAAGEDVPQSIEITAPGNRTISLSRGDELADEKSDNLLARALTPASLEGLTASQDKIPGHVLASMGAQRALILRANALLNHIEKFSGEKGVERKIAALQGSSRISESSVMSVITEKPEIVSLLAGPDAGPQLLKAKALLSLAEDAGQAAHNIGVGNIVAVDRGWYKMEHSVDRIKASGYKPLSQASFVRAYDRQGAMVVGSAYEALGSTMTDTEAKVVNALTALDGDRESSIKAADPVRVLSRTMSIGANLFSEPDEAMGRTPLFVKAEDTDAMEKAVANTRATRILRACSKTADNLMYEYFNHIGDWQDVNEASYHLSRFNSSSSVIGILKLNYNDHGFLRHMAHAIDGTSLLAATAQAMYRATDENLLLSKKLDDFVRNEWSPVNWSEVAGEPSAMTDAQQKTQVRMMASLMAAIVAVSPAHMRRSFNYHDARIGTGEFRHITALDAYLELGDAVGGELKYRVDEMMNEGIASVLNGLSFDAMKQIAQLAGQIFVKKELIDRLGSSFTNAEKLAIEAMMADTASRTDLIDGYDVDPIVKKKLPAANLKASKNDPNTSGLYTQQKNSMSHGVAKKMFQSAVDSFQLNRISEYASATFKDMRGIPGYILPMQRDAMSNAFGFGTSGDKKIVAGLHGSNVFGVSRLTSSGPTRLNVSSLQTRELSYDDSATFNGNIYVSGSDRTSFISADGANKGGKVLPALESKSTLGVLGAMFDAVDPVDLILQAPETNPGIIDVNVGASGRSALSQSVIRSFLADSIIGRAQRAGSKTIEIAPAGGQLSFGGAGVMEMTGSLSSGKLDEAVMNIHGRGLRTISKTSFSHIHRDKKKQAVILSNRSGKLPGSDMNYPEYEAGTGYLGDPYRAGEQPTKKGYAWKRLPDGRIMVNVSGDHLGYKLDGTITRPGRVGYGFSLSEGLGYDPNSGLLLPGTLMDQMMAFDAMSMLGHPLAATLDFDDPAIMQAYVDGALNDKRGYHHSRGKIDDADRSMILTSSSSFSGRLDRADFKAFLQDAQKIYTRRAFHAASYQDINASGSYMTFILPAGLSAEEIAAHLMTIHVDPTIGYALQDAGKRRRVDRAATMFPDATFMQTRQQRSVYTESPSSKRIVPHDKKGAYGLSSLEGLRDSVALGVSQDPHLWSDVLATAAKMTSQEGGYFLPDTERALSINGDTGLAISSLFPGRPDLLAHSWDAKAANGIKIWKRYAPKNDTNFRPYVVELNSPSMITAEGGLAFGKRAMTFKTEAEANAYANKVATQATSASLVRALSGGNFRLVERPGEGGGSKFFADASVSSVDRIIPQVGRAFEEALEPSGLYRVGDLDMALPPADAKRLSKALSRNTHIEFDTPPVQLRQITGKSLDELEAVVRKKTNLGLPQGALNFSSKAMNAIIRGTHPSPSKKNFTHLTGSEWMKVLERSGVTKDEIRQTGLGHMLINYGEVSMSRQDLAEFVAASYPIMHRASPVFYGMHAAQQLAALGMDGLVAKSGWKGKFIPPYMHDSRVQSRANQIHAVQKLYEFRETLESKASTESEKQKVAALTSIIDERISAFKKTIGIASELDPSAAKAEVIGRLQELAKMPNLLNEFGSYDMRQLELTRLDINERIRQLAQDDADGKLFSDVGEIDTYVRTLMMPDGMPEGLEGESKELLREARDGLKASYGMNSGGPAELGQSMHTYGNFPYPSYVSGAFEQHYQVIVRYADKIGMKTMKNYLDEIKEQILRHKEKIAGGHPDAESLKAKLPTLEAMRETAERVMAVRIAASSKLQSESSRHHGSHFSGTMPSGTEMTGGGGAYELGHSRFSWAMMTSALGLDGFASVVGIDPNGELPLGFRREPVALIEEIQSDVFQNVDIFGTVEGADMFLPADSKEAAGMSRSGELAKLVAEHASLVSLADNASDTAIKQLSSIIGAPSGNNGTALHTGTKLFDKITTRLFLDQTDLFQRSMMHEAVPALLRNTGRKAKVPEGIRASISRMTNGMPAPKEIFVFDFDHELMDLVRMYPHFTRETADPKVFDFVQNRMLENMNKAVHADTAMAGMTNPRAEQGKRQAMDLIARGDLDGVIKNQLSIAQQIIARGVEALRANGYDALKNETNTLTAAGVQGSHAQFVRGLFDMAKSSGDIGSVVASHVARAMIKDEPLAMQMAAYIEGSGAVDYEGLVERTIENLRRDYGDSKSYIGKAVLLVLDELKRMPAEARPHMTAVSGFSDVKSHGVGALASTFRTAASAIEVGDDRMTLRDLASNLPDPNDRKNMIWVRVDGPARGYRAPKHMQLGAGTSNTFRTFANALEFVEYIHEAKQLGADIDTISIYEAPYHKHPGTAAGDFAKNVVEVFASMSQGPKFLEMAKVKEADLASLRKEVRETFKTDERGRADTQKGKLVVYPDVVPGVADGTYKSTQLIMNVLDSMNHGSHGRSQRARTPTGPKVLMAASCIAWRT